MSKVLTVILTFLLAFVVTGTANAEAKTVPVTASVTINQDVSTLALGSTVTFTTTVPKLAGWQYPMVSISCYQDVNGDGVINDTLFGGDLVYAELGHPTDTFTLGGASSDWRTNGGPAVCRADLYAYGWKGSQEYVTFLATTGDFGVLG